MMDIGVIGVGKLGICQALALEKAGYTVHCYDKYEPLRNAIATKTLDTIEPSVKEYLQNANRLVVHSSLENMYTLPTLFVVVATPSLPDGSYNHSAVDDVVTELLALNAKNPSYTKKLLVLSCTVMPTYSQTVADRLATYNYDVCYNPEFIAQGDVLNGMLKPDMVLIGASSESASAALVSLYKTFLENDAPFHCMSLVEAEITKISLNCFLTTKITFANMIGNIVETAGGRSDVVLSAIGEDSRVGKKFLKWGYGYGGPCLPRDNRALCHFANSIQVKHELGELVDSLNIHHVRKLHDFVLQRNTEGKPYFFDSVVYKKNTQILEESQKLALALTLAKNGHTVLIRDTPDVVRTLSKTYGTLFTFVSDDETLDMNTVYHVNSYIKG